MYKHLTMNNMVLFTLFQNTDCPLCSYVMILPFPRDFHWLLKFLGTLTWVLQLVGFLSYFSYHVKKILFLVISTNLYPFSSIPVTCFLTLFFKFCCNIFLNCLSFYFLILNLPLAKQSFNYHH